MATQNKIRHGAYYVTRGGRLAFIHKTKTKLGREQVISGWVYLPITKHWSPMAWYSSGKYLSPPRTTTWDIIGRWEGKMPAKVPMKLRRTHYTKAITLSS